MSTDSVLSKTNQANRELVRYINLKLVALGAAVSHCTAEAGFMDIAGPLLRNHYEKDERLGWPLCPADTRIQTFLEEYLKDVRVDGTTRLPARTFELDRTGLARILSLPPNVDRFASPYLTSYRIEQGVLHNPKNDRRTTKGIFHIVEGGYPVPEDKLAVPRQAFAALLSLALQPPEDVLALPFTANQPDGAKLFVSLLLRPLVCPRIGEEREKTMEVRVFAPGSLVSNLDFLEGIFGNAGDPFLPENDAALDVLGWTGHTGCIILAPHLVGAKKSVLGLPHYDRATERQRRDGMCYRNEEEPYNDGRPFKISCRNARGVMVTIIADNYYGYCKKEVKTIISYAANLYGLCEEEHAGGAYAYPTYILGQDFYAAQSFVLKDTTFERAMELLAERVEIRPGRCAIDRKYPDVMYVPEDAEFHVGEGVVSWSYEGHLETNTLDASFTYILPSGYKVRLEKQRGGGAWRLVGSRPDGVLCHKPCTVSGGGKSEISKSLRSMIQPAPIFVSDYERDLQAVAEILERDFTGIYRDPSAGAGARARRPILSRERSLGSVIKLLTASPEYTDEHNAWVASLSQTIRQLVFVLKRYYRPEWGSDWRRRFTVDRINGVPGHELKFDNQRLVGNYLRVGFEADGASWRMYKLRPDFNPADKIQAEDDITVSVVVPREKVVGLAEYRNASVKVVTNCETLLFQRPDDAIIRGFDLQAEADIATPETFITNFEPYDHEQAKTLVMHIAQFDRYSEPMKRLLRDFVNDPHATYVVSSAHPRLVDGTPSKNPRYLQRRPDRVDHRATYIAETGRRLHEEIPCDVPVFATVHAVLAGRKANRAQPEIGLPPLAVYNPIHYQDLPELFMDFLCSLTGKSPSTTGFGSEGALTKGPFNAIWPVVDMNNAIVSAILTEYAGFTSVAGYLGPNYRIDHDISMLVPEIWCRMTTAEREPQYLISNGFLEKVDDFEYQGRKVLASRLGYRITSRFVDHFFGRVFETPSSVFTEELLRPEKQDLDAFVAGVTAIVDAQTRVAKSYFDDGSVEAACPPLQALLHIMVYGNYSGMDLEHPKLRDLFSRKVMMESDWYRERLETKQRRDIALWRRHEQTLETAKEGHRGMELDELRTVVREKLAKVSSPEYLQELAGTLGADPFHLQTAH